MNELYFQSHQELIRWFGLSSGWGVFITRRDSKSRILKDRMWNCSRMRQDSTFCSTWKINVNKYPNWLMSMNVFSWSVTSYFVSYDNCSLDKSDYWCVNIGIPGSRCQQSVSSIKNALEWHHASLISYWQTIKLRESYCGVFCTDRHCKCFHHHQCLSRTDLKIRVLGKCCNK